MDRTLARLRQILAAINRRRFFEERERISMNGWMTRQLATFIAQGYMTTKENPAIEAASMLAYDEIEKAQLEEAAKRHAETPKVKENSVGSYERLMGSLADPKRWAGR